MSASVITYLSFSGNCEEAVKTYIDIFGGSILYMSRWDEENYEKKCQIGKVMHVEFMVGDTHMSGGDLFEDFKVSGVKLMVHTESKEKAVAYIEKLAMGGKVIAPLKAHPAPDDAGMGSVIMDRFGYTWIITCPNPDKVVC